MWKISSFLNERLASFCSSERLRQTSHRATHGRKTFKKPFPSVVHSDICFGTLLHQQISLLATLQCPCAFPLQNDAFSQALPKRRKKTRSLLCTCMYLFFLLRQRKLTTNGGALAWNLTASVSHRRVNLQKQRSCTWLLALEHTQSVLCF